MLQEFVQCYQLKTGSSFDVKRWQIRWALHIVSHQHCSQIGSSRCLTHIINLAAQAVISACSKSMYYNGNPTDNHLSDDLDYNERDEIGIVQAICIKACTVFP